MDEEWRLATNAALLRQSAFYLRYEPFIGKQIMQYMLYGQVD